MTAIATPIVLSPAGRSHIDPARTTVAVTATHLFGLGTVTAMFAQRNADVIVGETDTATTVHAVIDAGTVASGHTTRGRDIRCARRSWTPLPTPTYLSRSARSRCGTGRWARVVTIAATGTRY